MRTPSRTGRRPGDTSTRSDILAAAAARFTEHGFQNATVRAIAADAGVDAALVHYFFGTKERLFVRAMELPVDPGDLVTRLLEPGIDGMGERLVGELLTVLDRAGAANPMLALIRSATGHPAGARLIREFLTHAVLDRVAGALGADRPRLRAALCASQIVGLIVAREIVALAPLPETDRSVLIAAYGPALQHYLSGPLP